MAVLARNDAIVSADTDALRGRYQNVRSATDRLAAPLSAEDQAIQSMPDVSPTKWHRAHVTWFFETFLLQPHLAGYEAFDPAFNYLFNSYYEQVGERHPRPQRGLISRPPAAAVTAYRAHVDAAMSRLIESPAAGSLAPLIELGLNHEQQHQELLLMDIKHVFSCNPLAPAYHDSPSPHLGWVPALSWIGHSGGVVEVGHRGEGFAFDNEGPRHRAFLEPFRIANRLVTNGEWLEFMADHGYRRPELWLSDGWATVKAEQWEAPLYWSRDGADGWSIFTLAGRRPVDPREPVGHISYYEADAYARWAGFRLPTEAEWETVAGAARIEGNFVESGALHPVPAREREAGVALQSYGDVWEWTMTSYGPYPGFRPAIGAVGEYNGKFMINQMILRGGSCATPVSHIRDTYRNFFYPHQRWAFAGVRLAADAS